MSRTIKTEMSMEVMRCLQEFGPVSIAAIHVPDASPEMVMNTLLTLWSENAINSKGPVGEMPADKHAIAAAISQLHRVRSVTRTGRTLFMSLMNAVATVLQRYGPEAWKDFCVLMHPNCYSHVRTAALIALQNPDPYERWWGSCREARLLGLPVLVADSVMEYSSRPTDKWVFPEDPFWTYEPSDEVWARALGFGRPATEPDQPTILLLRWR